MIHPRTLKILVVVLLLHAGVLMLIQLGLIAPRPPVEEPLEIQAHIIPAAPAPITATSHRIMMAAPPYS